jgi:hypothetical protein
MKRYAAVFILLAGLALSGCAQASAGGGDAAPTSTPSEIATPTPTPTPTPASVDSITVGVDALVATRDGKTVTYPYTDPQPLIAFVEELTGVTPESEDIEDPWGNGDLWGTKYTWDDISVSEMESSGAGVRISAATVAGVPVATAQGIAVGSTSEEVLAAGGWATWNDGVSYYFGVDPQTVEGTQSLSRPGEVGRAYVDVTTVDDVVTALTAPANDYSDI